MAVDYRILIMCDVSVLGETKSTQLIRKVIQAIETHTVTPTTFQSFSDGARGDIDIQVGVQTAVDMEIMVAIDAAVTADEKASILTRILTALGSESLNVVVNGSPIAGTPSLVLTVT